MKNTIFGILSCLIVVSCGYKETQNTMTVTGKVKGLKKGTLYLQHIPDTSLVVIDSIKVSGDGSFLFQTELESPEIFYLYLDKKDNNDINDRITFFGEPGTITINTNWNTFDTKAKIEGSKTHKKLEEYRKVMSRFNTTNLEILRAVYDPETPQDSLTQDSIQKASENNIRRGYLFALNFALNNKESHIAPFIALKEVPDANIIYLDSINHSLSPEVAKGKYGRALKEYLEEQKNN
jgi:hypothetical protein